MAYASPRPVYPARAPPPPVRTPRSPPPRRSPTPTSPSFALANDMNSPEKLLYQLPPQASPLRSPPPLPGSPRTRSPPVVEPRRTSFGIASGQARPNGKFNRTSIDTRGTSPAPSSAPKHHGLSLSLNDVTGPKQADLDAFAELCRRSYYDQHGPFGEQMTIAINSVPSSHRAAYSRVQASVRSAYHSDQALRRITDFRALLASTHSGNSLTPAARASPSGPIAKKERLDRLGHFIQTHCTSGVPGTHPFFQGLYGLLRLQSLPEKLGGAGDRVVDWELDDAVFIETAGKDFTLEAVAVLKGVLGFEERLLTKTSGTMPSSESAVADEFSDDEGDELLGPSAHGGHAAPSSSTRLRQLTASESFSQRSGAVNGNRGTPPPVPLRKPSGGGGNPQERQQGGTTAQSPELSRTRAPSDPFIDPSRSQASSGFSSSPSGISSVSGSGSTTPLDSEPPHPPSTSTSAATLTPPAYRTRGGAGRYSPAPSPRRHTAALPLSSSASTPTTPSNATNPFDSQYAPMPSSTSTSASPQFLALLSEPQIRLWTFPNTYTNPEIHKFLALFPSFITEKGHLRFKASNASSGSANAKSKSKRDLTARELEEGLGSGAGATKHEEGIKVGSGTMRRSEIRRADGWKGSMWDRLMAWFRDLFG